MFKEELAALKDAYLTRFNLVHVLSREARDIELLHGRIDRAKADALLAHWLDLDRRRRRVRLRPDGMMQAVAEALKARGLPGREDQDRALRRRASRSTSTGRRSRRSRATPSAR